MAVRRNVSFLAQLLEGRFSTFDTWIDEGRQHCKATSHVNKYLRDRRKDYGENERTVQRLVHAAGVPATERAQRERLERGIWFHLTACIIARVTLPGHRTDVAQFVTAFHLGPSQQRKKHELAVHVHLVINYFGGYLRSTRRFSF